MRAFLLPLMLSVLLLTPYYSAAETAVREATAQREPEAAGDELAKAALREAERLRQMPAESTVPDPVSGSTPASRIKIVEDAGEKSLQSKHPRVRLQEAERVRIRDEYRVQQKRRIAARLAVRNDPLSASKPEKKQPATR